MCRGRCTTLATHSKAPKQVTQGKRRSPSPYVDNMLVKSNDEADHLDNLKETFNTLCKYKMKLNPMKYVFAVSLGKFLGFMVFQRGIEANLDKIKVKIEIKSPKMVKELQSLTEKVTTLNRFVSRATDKCLPFFKVLKKAF